MMLTTRNITSRTSRGSCHMKYTNLCNEKKKNQTINTKVFNLKDQTTNNQTNISKEVIQPCENNLVIFLF
jgi:hypothetical protein